jgi:DNA-binding protein Fis
MKKSELEKLIKEAINANMPAVIPNQTADVKNVTRLLQSNTSLMNRLKTINNGQEVTEFFEFVLNNINEKVSGIQKQKIKTLIDQRFK